MDIIEVIWKASDSFGKFIDDLRKAWLQGDRRRVLLVGFVVLFIVCASQQEWLRASIPFLKNIPQLPETAWINILWILSAILFIWIIYESIKPPLPPPLEPTEFKESVAIKGLRSFTEKDQEIFKELQRNRVLQNCLAEINRDRFRFGVLFGESGCGKTSFIKAGLIPQLSQADSKFQGIYVRFSERDPLVSIRQAFVEKLPLFPEDISQLDFLTLLSQGVEAASKPLVLIFDQFEQFFVHFKRKEERQFFIQALADWYKDLQPPQVKIVFCIRQDFYAYLVELQKAFSYSPSPQEVIELEKFSPEEATNIMEVIAKTTEGLEIDPQFIKEVAEQELTSGENGLISPVNLQLLAWIINGQKSSELRGFNEKAFQKLGGIEGLLTKFLERILQTRITENQRQATIKVLLSLTDSERRVRAGILTFEEVQHKLPDLSTSILQETINWLKSDGVRLITPIEREKITGYELAHEKMIPALLKLVDKELPEADITNQLLERRVNEWLSNNCDAYYLLRWRELKLIQKQKAYLKWGRNRQHKLKLIYESKRHFQVLSFKVVSLLIIIGLFWLGSKYYFSTSRGEIQQIRWELNRVSKLVDEGETKSLVAITIAKYGDLKQALKIANQMDTSLAHYQASALRAITKLIGSLDRPQEEITLLKQALTIANQIDDSSSKASTLRVIAEAIGSLDQPQEGITLIKQALITANQINDLHYKAWTLSWIATAFGSLDQPQEGITLLKQALNNANQIDDLYYKGLILRVIAKAIDSLDQPQEGITLLKQALITANQIDDLYHKARTLSAIAEAVGSLDQPQEGITLLKQAVTIANQIDDSSSKVSVLREIATVFGSLDQPQERITLLKQALITANQIDASSGKAFALIETAKAIGLLDQPQEGTILLKQALITANQIDDLYYKAWTLSAIATAFGSLDQLQEEIILLKQALNTANQMDASHFNKGGTLNRIAEAIGSLNQAQKGITLLKQALTIANQIDDRYDKVRALSAIAETIGLLDQPQEGIILLKQALTIANQLDDSFSKVEALSAIATAFGSLDQTQEGITLLKQALTIANQLYSSSSKAWALIEIAQVQAQFGNWGEARKISEKISIQDDKAKSLAKVLTIWTEKQNTKRGQKTITR